MNLLLNHLILYLLLIENIKSFPQQQQDNKIVLATKKGRYLPELYGATQGKYVPDYSGKYQHIQIPYDGGYGDRGVKYVQIISGPDGYQYNNLNGETQSIENILQKTAKELNLGPNDHLRFSIDFNFNGTGWQVIQFEWIRDDETDKSYNYANEYKLWENVVDNQDKEQQNFAEHAQDFNDHDHANWSNDANPAEQPAIETHAKAVSVDEDNAQVTVEDTKTTTTDQTIFEAQLSPLLYSFQLPTDINSASIRTEQSKEETNVGQDVEHVHVDDNYHQQNENEKNDIQAVIYDVLEYIQTKVLPKLNK